MSHKRCFVYLCYDFLLICILSFTKSCFVYLCYDFPMICILCLTSVVLYICVLLSLLLVFYVSQALFCTSVLWFPHNWYFMFHKRCFVYLCYDFLIICILCFTKSCFVYLCYDFPIICILCLTRFVLYICVLLSLLLVFYVSQALFCISVLWFPYNWYFMFHKCCFVYLCYDFPIIDILCFTLLFCVSVFSFPYNWYFMSHNRCFVYLCYDFPIIGILCLTRVVLYICVMNSL
jgi:hypothetical protein